MSTWLVHNSCLTPVQEEIIREKTDKNLLLTGAPGSGKTLVLSYRLHHFLFERRFKKDKVRFFVFTKSLKNYIRDGIKILKIPDNCINTFDSWCYDYYSKNIGTPPRINNDGHLELDYHGIRCGILDKIEKSKNSCLYDCVLVDEGQDMAEEVYKILKIISKHVTVCMDDKQQIYDTGINKAKVEEILGIRRDEIRNINEAWRCSPYIVKLSSVFISNKDEREYFLKQNRKPLEEKQVPFVAFANSYDLTNAKMAELIKERMTLNESIAILAPKNKIVHGIGKSLKNLGIDVECDEKEIDFSTDKPKVMTYHKAKGLTFDSVFLPSLINTNFSRFNNSGVSRRMLFVGISRAVKWVYMDFTKGSGLIQIDELFKLQNTGDIHIEELVSPDTPNLFVEISKTKGKKKIQTNNIEDII